MKRALVAISLALGTALGLGATFADEPTSAVSASDYLARIGSAREADDYATLLSLVDRAVDEHPDDARLQLERADVLFDLYLLEDARTSSERAVELAPSSAEAHLLRGVIAWQSGDAEQARASAERVAELSPSSEEAARWLKRFRSVLQFETLPVSTFPAGSAGDFVHSFARSLAQDPAATLERDLGDAFLIDLRRAAGLAAEPVSANRWRGDTIRGIVGRLDDLGVDFTDYLVVSEDERDDGEFAVWVYGLGTTRPTKAFRDRQMEIVQSDQAAKQLLDPSVWRILRTLSVEQRAAFLERSWDHAAPNIYPFLFVVSARDDGYQIDEIHTGDPPVSLARRLAHTTNLVAQGVLNGDDDQPDVATRPPSAKSSSPALVFIGLGAVVLGGLSFWLGRRSSRRAG